MSEFSFSDLSLKGVEAAKGAGILAPGRYPGEIVDAKWKASSTGGKMIEILAKDQGGAGMIKGWINVAVPSSQEATRIGREQLKALLVHGGHPDPDNVGDYGIGSLKGLTPGLGVVPDEYEKNGVKKKGSKLSYYFDPAELGDEADASEPPAGDGQSADLDDNIPF